MKLLGLEPQWEEFDGVRFKIRPLTGAQRFECLSFCEVKTMHIMFTKACEYAVADWDGVEDDKGPVQFETKLVEQLPEKTWAAIARRVLKINDLGAEDKKN